VLPFFRCHQLRPLLEFLELDFRLVFSGRVSPSSGLHREFLGLIVGHLGWRELAESFYLPSVAKGFPNLLLARVRKPIVVRIRFVEVVGEHVRKLEVLLDDVAK
jgi:hypothetical protein